MIQADVILVTLRILQLIEYLESQPLLPPGLQAKGH